MGEAGYNSMKRLFVAIVCAAVMLSFLSGNVSLESAQRSVSHAGCAGSIQGAVNSADPARPGFDLASVPAYSGEPSVAVNGNVPFFTDTDRKAWADGGEETDWQFLSMSAASSGVEGAYALQRGPYEWYSALDRQGRCGTAYALVGRETMPKASRGSIGMVRPSGWRIAKYPWIDGEYLFNRCHLIAFQLTGQNGNELNLITGTRSMNVAGMLPYEDEVAYYVRRTGNHVLYRVTPVFEGRNLIASGVLMEAESYEDGGEDVSFCAWCYNTEPGVTIDYATGANRADGSISPVTGAEGGDDPDVADGAVDAEPVARSIDPDATYVLNTGSHKFHMPDCPSVSDMSSGHLQEFYGSREEALELGYDPCGWCQP